MHLVHDEARSYLTRHADKYRVIQASLIDTWAATGAGAHALGENGLYTVEAFRTFLAKLEPGGVLTVSRWSSIETPRLLALGMAALFDEGEKNPRSHLALLASGPVSTLLLGKDPLTHDDVTKLEALASAKGFYTAVLPDRPAALPTIEHILAATDREDLDRRTLLPALDLRPPTDDRPFFFNVVRLGAALGQVPTGETYMIEGNLLATRTLGLALFASLVLVIGAVAVPLARRANPKAAWTRRSARA